MSYRPLLGMLAAAASTFAASAAVASDFVQVVNPDPFTTIVQVNGTPDSDLILLESLCDGSVGALRISPWSIRIEVIDASLVASAPIVVFAGGGADLIDTQCLDASVVLEVHGEAGADTVYCGPGDDLVFGEDGDDYICGGAGNDTLFGNAGSRDQLFGNDGNDSLSDEDGATAAKGGENDDSISIVFDPSWDNNSNPFDFRSSIGKIAGGGGDDYVSIVVLGSPIRFAIDGDSGTATPGAADVLEYTGAADTASLYVNFEFTVFIP